MIIFIKLSKCNLFKLHSMKNQDCKVRPEIVNVNSNEPVFYPFSFKTSKCSSSCNNINDPYTKMSVPDVVKDFNVKVFNLMSKTNEQYHQKTFGFFVFLFFSIWLLLQEYSQFTGQQVKGEAISLYPFYHFHPFHRLLDITWVIATESSPLSIAGSRN